MAIHDGLGCGILDEKFPGMDMISFGLIIKGAHCPVERVKVVSVGRFYELLTETLAGSEEKSQVSEPWTISYLPIP